MSDRPQRVIITGVDVPFSHLVVLLVKLAIAAIPAVILLSMLYALIALVLMILAAGYGATM